jgi:nucleoside-diphosphate-sugar epimerase
LGAKILITGGSGFIGTNVVEFYIQKGFVVLNLDVQLPKNNNHLHVWKKVDILDKPAVKIAITEFQPHYVIHLAARTDLNGNNLNDYKANTQGTSILIDSMSEVDSIKKVIFTSSMLVCKLGYTPKDDMDFAPTTIYGESKVLMENLIRDVDHHYEYAIVRPTSIWGPWFGTPYKDFFDMVIKNRYFNIGKNRVQKTYGFVGNTVQQINDILTKAPNGSLFYLGDSPPLVINNWANTINKIIRKNNVRTLPMWFVTLLAKGGDILKKIHLPFPMTSFLFKNMTTDNIVNVENTIKMSEPKYIDEIEKINITLNWIKEYEKK